MPQPTTHPKTHRLEWRGRACLIPQLAMVGWDSPRTANERGLGSHSHRGVYEICYIVEGGVQWWVRGRDGKIDVFNVEAGQVFISQPDEEHGGVDSALHPCELYWLQIKPQKKPTLPAWDLSKLKRRVFPGSQRTRDAFAKIVLEHTLGDPFSPAAVDSELHELLALLARDHAAAGQSQTASPQVRQAMQWMIEHLPENFSVADVADAVGLSDAVFAERFHAELGYTPTDWRTRQRVLMARRRMIDRPDESILDTALACGFSSSQYFATTFKKVFGLSPRDLRSKRTS